MSTSLPVRILAVLGAVIAFVLAGALTYGIGTDFAAADRVPLGVTVGTADVGGLDEPTAIGLVEEEVAAPLLSDLTIRHNGRSFTFTAREALAVDVTSMVEAAYEPRETSPLTRRAWREIAQEPVSHDVTASITVDDEAVSRFVRQLATKIDTLPADAQVGVKDSTLTVTPSAPGFRTRIADAEKALAEALASGSKAVELPVDKLEPKITEGKLGRTIIVDESQRKLYLYKGVKLEKIYRVAVGTARYPTPKGNFEIVEKRYRPTWRNPGSGWATGMPASIPPGPGNPLGTRAMNLNADGIRIHGTSNTGSIGSAASHGCMRMLRHDVEELFDLVKVGTKVFIVP